MPVDSAGNATRPPSPIPVTGQTAQAAEVNVPVDDIYSILNMLPFLDGRKPLQGNIQMNGYNVTGAADAATGQQFVTLAQVQAMFAGISTIPVGVMQILTGTTIPAGWLRANGQSVSRSTFPELWAWVQTSGNLAATQGAKTVGQYGPGDGSTTFTLPNMEADGGYFARSVTSGRNAGSVQADSVGPHNHPASFSGNAVPPHTHGYSTSGGAGNAYGGGVLGSATGTTGSAGGHTPSGSVTVSNNTGTTETRPKNIGYIYIIKA